MSDDIPIALRTLVRKRAHLRCAAVGQVAEFLLQLNRPDRLNVRQILYQSGLYPR